MQMNENEWKSMKWKFQVYCPDLFIDEVIDQYFIIKYVCFKMSSQLHPNVDVSDTTLLIEREHGESKN